uniref:protein-tyrosine-phosphatase n=1 Tax=Aureoumbra lagunensis TaxID=44058 RepID=A0A7S3NEU8_9STRA|mmetsp:Transcript_20258/g.30907  ORF Transcript_20258/g.30907 Transcript_20258/m.30907 type:complete len:506 (-) Transcript_20258:241-1758(-)
MGKLSPKSSLGMRSVVTLNDDRRVVVSLDQEVLRLSEEQRWFSKRPLELNYAVSQVDDVRLVGRELFLIFKDKVELRLKCGTTSEAEAWLEAIRVVKQSPRIDYLGEEYSCEALSTIPSIASLTSSGLPNSARALSVTSIRSSNTVHVEEYEDILSPTDGDGGDDMIATFSDEDITPIILPRVQSKVKPISTSADVSVNDDIRYNGYSKQIITNNFDRKRLIIPAVECPHHDDPSSLGCTQLCSFLYIGGRAIASDRQGLQQFGITHIVNMAVECSNFFAPCHQYQRHNHIIDFSTSTTRNSIPSLTSKQEQNLIYLHCPCTDKSNDDISPHLDVITRFIHQAQSQGGKILVHCNSGISRSSAAVLAYLIRYGIDGNGGFSLIDAMHWLRDKRRIASPHPAYMCQLCQYEVALRGGQPTLNQSTYSNNRYEDVEKLHASMADPRSTAQLLGRGDRNEQLSPVYFSKNFSQPPTKFPIPYRRNSVDSVRTIDSISPRFGDLLPNKP